MPPKKKRNASPAQLANLAPPFKKGEEDPRRHVSKKRISFEACVAKVLDEKLQGDRTKTKRMALAERFVDELLRSSNQQARILEMFIDREWPVTQFISEQIEHTYQGPFTDPFLSTEEVDVHRERVDGTDRKDH